MKKLFSYVVLAASLSMATQAQAQQLQGDFDSPWEDCTPYGSSTVVGQQPAGWGASNVCQKFSLFPAQTKELVTQDADCQGNESGYSAKLENKFVGVGNIGSNAPGFLSLGTAWAMAKMSGINIASADGGCFGGKDFTYRPDALKFYYKRTHGEEQPEEKATVVAYLWKGSYKSNVQVGVGSNPPTEEMTDRDRDVLGKITEGVTKSDDAALIASVEWSIGGNTKGWASMTVPFTYHDTEAVPEKINVLFSSADYFADREGIGADNTLWVDDVELVYYHTLSDLQYDGTTIYNFSGNTTDYYVNAVYDPAKISWTKKGIGSTVESNYDEETAVLTITVKGNDYESNPESQTVYTLRFSKGETTSLPSQLRGDFESPWEVCVPYGGEIQVGFQPAGWGASNVNQLDFVTSELVTPGEGHEGLFSAEISNKFIGFGDMGQNAPGYLSLGTAWATAMIDEEFVISNADGGTFGGQENFNYRPDAVNFFYKRSHGEDKPNETATVVAYLWKGSYKSTVPVGVGFMAEPEKEEMTDRDRDVLGMIEEGVTKSDDAALIATLNHSIEGDAAEWTELTLPFTYQDNEAVPEKINVLFSSADYFADRSGIGAGNTLWVDDVKLVYWHALADLQYDGAQIEGFAEDKTDYDLSDVVYDASKLTFVKKGAGATVETNYEEATQLLTITVKGNDYEENSESVTTYTVKFRKPDVIAAYTNPLTVAQTSTDAPAPTAFQPEVKVEVNHKGDGTVAVTLHNLKLNAELPAGTLVLDNVSETEGSFSATGYYTFQAGDEADVEWLGPNWNEVEVDFHAFTDESGVLRARFTLGTAAACGFDAVCVFAPNTTISAGSDVTTEATGCGNVTVNPAFAQGWTTVCLPFATTPEALGASQAQAFTGLKDGNKLMFNKVSTMEANVPYMVYFEEGTDATFYYGGEVAASEAQSVSYGEYTFQGNYTGSFALAGEGLYTFGLNEYEEVALTKGVGTDAVKSLGAYFSSTSSQAEGAVLALEGFVSGIGSATATPAVKPEAKGVYTLQGVKVSDERTDNLPTGVYIVNGRKVVVK